MNVAGKKKTHNCERQVPSVQELHFASGVEILLRVT